MSNLNACFYLFYEAKNIIPKPGSAQLVTISWKSKHTFVAHLRIHILKREVVHL